MEHGSRDGLIIRLIKPKCSMPSQRVPSHPMYLNALAPVLLELPQIHVPGMALTYVQLVERATH